MQKVKFALLGFSGNIMGLRSFWSRGIFSVLLLVHLGNANSQLVDVAFGEASVI